MLNTGEVCSRNDIIVVALIPDFILVLFLKITLSKCNLKLQIFESTLIEYTFKRSFSLKTFSATFMCYIKINHRN